MTASINVVSPHMDTRVETMQGMKEEKLSIRVSGRTRKLVQEIAEKMSVSQSIVIRALIDRSLSELEEKINTATTNILDL